MLWSFYYKILKIFVKKFLIFDKGLKYVGKLLAL